MFASDMKLQSCCDVSDQSDQLLHPSIIDIRSARRPIKKTSVKAALVCPSQLLLRDFHSLLAPHYKYGLQDGGPEQPKVRSRIEEQGIIKYGNLDVYKIVNVCV